MPDEPYDVLRTPLGKTPEIPDEQQEQDAEMDRLYLAVFNNPAGKQLLEVWERRMLSEDEPRFNIVNSDGFMYYTSGRRSMITSIRKTLNRITKG